jgi:PAS domain S-box-containing protein
MVDLSQLIDALPHLVWTADPEGRVASVNRGWREYTGLPLNAAIGVGWQSAVHAEDLPRLLECWRFSLDTGQPCEMQARLCRFDGAFRWFAFRASPTRDASGSITGWVGSIAEIADPDLRSIIDAIPTMAWTASPDGQCDFLNQRWLDYAGMTAAEALGSGWAAAMHPADRERIAEYWQGCLTSGTPVVTEARLRRYDGAYRWFLFLANPVRDAVGTITKWYGSNLDIEDRKRGEQAVLERELSWRQIVDNIPGLVATMGPTGEVEFLNRHTLDYFGRSAEDLKHWSLIGAVHPDDLPRIIRARAKSLETGQLYEVEHRCRRADGVYRWFQVRGVPVRNADGAINAWYFLLTDIEDRKQAEEAVQSNERNLSLILNTIPAYIHVLRSDGSVLYVNQAVLDYTGLTLEDVRRDDYRARVFHPEDVARLREERDNALKRAVPFENEQRVLHKDGSYRWLLIRYSPLLDAHGNLDRWYVAAADIDDRKRAEAQVEQAYIRLAEAQRLSKTGSFITDLLADDHDWSEEAFRIFEFNPATRPSVQMIRDLVCAQDLPSFDAGIQRSMNGAEFDLVFRIRTASGNIKYLHAVARVIRHLEGRPLFIGALQDVTERVIAEQALSEARSELAHVSRVMTLGALTASIAHEVNQPLAGIITNAATCLRMLAADPPNLEGARATTQRTLRDGNRASEVIRRLRTLYSHKQPKYEALDLNDAAREVVALSISELQRAHVILRTDFHEGLPPINGDRVQLQQVLLNLILNAVDAMREINDRPRDLLVTTAREEPDSVRLSVCDSGIGIDPQILEKIFDSFYTTKSTGMGMGLSISRSIIESHQGRLWGTANEGPGATFAFRIPCSTEQAPKAAVGADHVVHSKRFVSATPKVRGEAGL